MTGPVRKKNASSLLSGVRVLVVDDEPHVRRLVELRLTRLGGEVIKASDGRLGLERLSHIVVGPGAAQQGPLVVVLDLMMPHVDGISFMKRMQADEIFRNVPVVVLSAVSDSATRQEVMALGATALISKPFDADHLIAAVARAAFPDSQPEVRAESSRS
ncbi:MAG: response regulator [Planctomycetota bacterium]